MKSSPSPPLHLKSLNFQKSLWSLKSFKSLLPLCLGALILKADLITNSPFIPEGWQHPSERAPEAPKVPTIPPNLELRGIDEWNGSKSFYLFDKVKLIGHWVTLNDQSADTPVLSVDDSSESTSISVRINGKAEKLTLRKPDGKALEIKGLAVAPVAPPPPPPGTAIPPPNGGPLVLSGASTSTGAAGQATPGGGPGGFDRSQVPGYNASLAANDPANIAAMRTYFDSRRGEREKEKAAAPQATTPATTTTTTPDNPQRRPLLNESNDRNRSRGR